MFGLMSSISFTWFAFSLGAPCLSFDILRDELGENREAFPHTAFIVAGTQSPKNSDNAVVVIKVSIHFLGKPEGS